MELQIERMRGSEESWSLLSFFYFIFQAARLTSAQEPRPPLWHPPRRLRLLLQWWNLRSPRRTSWISLPKWAHQTVVTVNTAMPAPSCPSSASQAVSSHWYSAYQGRMYHFTYNRQTETVCTLNKTSHSFFLSETEPKEHVWVLWITLLKNNQCVSRDVGSECVFLRFRQEKQTIQ